MGTIFNTLHDVVMAVIGTSLTSFITLITSNPYLLIGVSLMLIGVGVSFLMRLIRV